MYSVIKTAQKGKENKFKVRKYKLFKHSTEILFNKLSSTNKQFIPQTSHIIKALIHTDCSTMFKATDFHKNKKDLEILSYLRGILIHFC